MSQQFKHLNPNAAGIDIGSESHFVAIPEGRDSAIVREFSCFTGDLNRLADWLVQCGITTVAMESTGVYWIPIFEILESRGLEVKLVNARRVKNVPGRKTDVEDCQWLQQLHSYGLLSGAFRPAEQICVLRAFLRQRSTLVQYASAHVQHMQKALTQMNLLLHNVVSDITGVTGMKIILAVLAGERNPQKLAALRNCRCNNSEASIAKSLVGNYRKEHLFSLRQAVELFQFYQDKITECDREIEHLLAQFDAKTVASAAVKKKSKPRKGEPCFDVAGQLFRMTGVNLLRIDGISSLTALQVIAEIGVDMNRWPSSKHFASWLGLCPGNKISGGKRLSGKTRLCANKAATALRMAAQSLYHAKCALGAYYRRQKARLGAPKAITAVAHKLAKLIYNMLKYGNEYVDAGQDYYEKLYQAKVIQSLRKRARDLGFELTENSSKNNTLQVVT